MLSNICCPIRFTQNRLTNGLWSNRYVAGTGWSAAEQIGTTTGSPWSAPQIAVDGNGNVVAVWEQWDAMKNIYSNRYVVGIGWGTTELIETDDVGHAVRPQVAIGSSGNAIAVWHQSDGIRDNIWSNRYVAGTGWGIAELVETDDTAAAQSPQVVIDGNGNAIVAWNQSGSIYSKRYVPGAGWSAAELIETGSNSAYFHDIAFDNSGNAVAVWSQWNTNGSRCNIWSNRYVAGTGWSVAELIESDDTENGNGGQIAVGGNGNAVALWRQHDGTRYNIWSNRYVAGTGWGTAELIETDNTGNASEMQIAIDGSGNAVAVWNQSDGTRNNIWSNHYATGTGWGTAQLIETNNTGDTNDPQVAIDGSGNAIAVWSLHYGSRDHIWSNRYE